MPKKTKLTDMQKLFCHEYLIDLNATKAAERAGFSAKTAQPASSRLMKDPMISEYIQKLMDRRASKVDSKAEGVLQELTYIGHSDIREIFDEAGCVKPVSEWPTHIARAVASIEVFEEYQGSGNERQYIGQTKKVKFWDKPKALELKGKNERLFSDRVEVTGKVTLEDLVAGSHEAKK
jgi:phage terminase small subunit